MDKELTEILAGLQRPDPGQRTPFCPEDRIVAAWYEKRLRPEQAEQFEQHLLACQFCRSRIGMLARLEARDADPDVPQDLLARSKQMAAGPKAGNRLSSAWAAAAVVVLAIGLAVSQSHDRAFDSGSRTGTGVASDAPRQLRSVKNPSPRPEIILPKPNAVVAPGGLRVEWLPVEGAIRYEVLLMDNSGALLQKQELQETRWQPESMAARQHPGDLFLRVNAYFPDGRAIASHHVAISIRPDRGAGK